MNIKYILLLFLIFPLSLWGQKKVILEGTATYFKDGDTIILTQVLPMRHFSDRKKWITLLKNGKFKFEFEENNAELYYLRINSLRNQELFLAPGYNQVVCKDSLWRIMEVKTPIALEYHNLDNEKLSSLEGEFRYLRAYYGEYLNQKDAVPEVALEKEKQLDSAEQAFHAYSIRWSSKWIQANPNSAISSKVLYDQLGFMPDDTLKNLYRLIPDSLMQNSYGKYLQYYVNHLTIGTTAPNIIQKTPEGETVRLTDFRGKYVLIDFWASWCIPCRQVNPRIVAAYQKFKNKNFTILGVSFDRNQKDWVKAIENDKLTWHHISELKSWDNQAAKDYRISSIPNNVLINPEGKIIARSIDPSKLEEVLGQFLGSKK